MIFTRMDLTKIKSAILNQLTDTNSLYSLKLQNHIYGCFIIMEDLAQDKLTLSDMVLSTPKYKFDLDKHFHMLGIRYGFVMDTQLSLERFSAEYHDLWIEIFKHIYLTKDLTEVDKIEDYIIELVQGIFKHDDAFFIHALDTGSLPQEWIEKVLNLINSSMATTVTAMSAATVSDQTTTVIDSYMATTPVTISTPLDTVCDNTSKKSDIVKEKTDSDEETQTNAITKALIEKPVIRVRHHLSKTRRAHAKTDTKKKSLSKTRRH